MGQRIAGLLCRHSGGRLRCWGRDAWLPPSIVYTEGGQETKVSGTPVVASWTGDETLSARINEQVAHYTGQAELAETIQKGLEARAQGDVDAATRFLGRAAKLAHDSGNEET